MNAISAAAAIFLFAAQPTDRALTGWHVQAGDFAEQLAVLGIRYDSAKVMTA